MSIDASTEPAPAPSNPAARSLSGLRVVVTGATGGLGRNLVARLHGDGAAVVATGTSPEKLESLASAVPGLATVAADLTDEAAVRGFYESAVTQLGGLDVVVNLAGVSVPGAIAETDVEVFHRTMSANVLSTFLSCKHAIGAMTSGGLIVNVGSLAGHRANPTAPLYCTAKAAVAMFSDALALQVKKSNIRVTNVSPGGVDTPFWGDRKVDRSRLMSAADVTEVLAFIMTRPPHVVVHDIAFESFIPE